MEANLNAEKMRKITIERVEKFLSKTAWLDINLTSRIYPLQDSECVKLRVWHVPNVNPNETDKVTYQDMLAQPESNFVPAKTGEIFEPEWSTHWFKVDISLPKNWEGKEVHFIWDSTGEALLFEKGQPIQAFNGSTGNDRRDFHILTTNAKSGQTWSFDIEMVCCGMFGNSNGEFLAPPNGTKVFTLKKAQLQVFDRIAYNLWTDLSLILEMANNLPSDSVRGWQAVDCCRQITNICHTDDPETWKKAQSIAVRFLEQKNGESQHSVFATGHCHIDTAWLWPYSETRRKVARSWATQCRLMDMYKDFKFAASQAQQFEWIQDRYPDLFSRIQSKAKANQFTPIGATWVEMDCNIPSGESFARQFLLGQRFFETHFGSVSKVFWLPDTFGYSSQLPQIIKQSECEYFLTQKLSWNNINKFPHNTFVWVGLDGTGVLSHFPPADTYVSEANVKDLVQGTKNFKTKDKSNYSMMLFGWGDGGGGPDMNHIERLERLRDVDGVPKASMANPEEFFKRVSKEDNEMPKWVGELYFELHRGTYTTHAKNKLGNRKSELLLSSLELLATISSVLSTDKIVYPQQQINYMWKLLLLNQFHDVLPGTSIGLVYKDSARHYQEISISGDKLRRECIASIVGVVQDLTTKATQVAFNPLSWPRTAVVELEDGHIEKVDQPTKKRHSGRRSHPLPHQPSHNGSHLAVASAPGMGFGDPIVGYTDMQPVTIVLDARGGVTIENKHIVAVFDNRGRIYSLLHKATQREAISPGKLGNQFVMFEDVPFFWDAWDVEIYHTEKPVSILGYNNNVPEHQLKIIEEGPLRAAFEFTLDISQVSRLTQRVFLDIVSDILTFETSVVWNENRKFLKVEFPLNVHANQAWYSTQFGCQSRPNHKNTTWDMAKFEVCAQQWADLNEFGFGVAILNDCKYGYSCDDNLMRLSLLRSSKQPDETADVGIHSFKYGLLAHQGSHADAQLTRRGLEFNQPLQLVHTNADFKKVSYFEISDPKSSLILETVKRPETDSNQTDSNQYEDAIWVIIRMWESAGGRGIAKISTSLNIQEIRHVNILEREFQKEQIKNIVIEQNLISVPYNPFEVITLACRIKQD